MKTLLTLTAALLLTACQQNSILAGGMSRHSGTSNLNENQKLIGYEGTNTWKGNWRYGGVVTNFKNSYRKQSTYAGGVVKNCFSKVCLGTTLGLVTGYDQYGEVIPFGGFTADVDIWKGFGLYSILVPYTPSDGAVALVGFKYSWSDNDRSE